MRLPSLKKISPGSTVRARQHDSLPAVLTLFVVAVFLFGGSSRADTSSLLLLRPLAALVLTYAVIRFAGTKRTGLAVPIWCLCTLILFAGLQIVPLPPDVWASLPGREPLVAGLEAAGVEAGWSPISVMPMATLNAVGAMIVTLAGLLLFALAGKDHLGRAVNLFIVLMLISAVLALFQVILPSASALYPYRVTNDGYPVGLFANRNHQAVLLAATIPFILAYGERKARHGNLQQLWASRIVSLGFASLAVMTGSRAGAVLAIGAFLVAAPLLSYARIASAQRLSSRRTWLGIAALPLIVLTAAIGAFWLGGGAFERLAAKDSFDDLRFQILPEVFAMIEAALPWGWGFGTFPEVYEIYERSEMIRPSYINHAHNDWLEIVAEGGVVAPLIILGLVGWVLRTAWTHRAQIVKPRSESGGHRMAAFLGIAILVAGSFFDYPLRTPAGSVILMLFLAVLASSGTTDRPDSKRIRG